MRKYSDEQTALGSRTVKIETGLQEATVFPVRIGRFIKLIKKYKEPTELTAEMACELIDKIVVHEAVGKKPNRQQQTDIYYNFIGQFDLPLTAKEIAAAKLEAERQAAEKVRRKAKRSERAWLLSEQKPKPIAWRQTAVISSKNVSVNAAARSFVRTVQGRHFAILTVRKPADRPKLRKSALRKRTATSSGKRPARYVENHFGLPTVKKRFAPRSVRKSTAGRSSLPITTESNPRRKPEKQNKSRRTMQWKNSSQTSGQTCSMSLSGIITLSPERTGRRAYQSEYGDSDICSISASTKTSLFRAADRRQAERLHCRH